MQIAVTSQNFRTITGHAGKTRRFLIYHVEPGQAPVESGRLELPKEMSMHEWSGEGEHPLLAVDGLVTASCGDGFKRKMAKHDIVVTVTEQTDPLVAVSALV